VRVGKGLKGGISQISSIKTTCCIKKGQLTILEKTLKNFEKFSFPSLAQYAADKVLIILILTKYKQYRRRIINFTRLLSREIGILLRISGSRL